MLKGNLVLLVDHEEDVYIGEDIIVRVVHRQGRRTRIRITAPLNVQIERGGNGVGKQEPNGNR